MTASRMISFAAVCALAATPLFADAGGAEYKANLYDADYETALAEHGFAVGVAVYGAHDAGYDGFFTTAATFNPLRTSSDAGYEALLADRGFAVGTAVYGANDADYGAVLTPANFFETAAFGQHDAGYEVIAAERGLKSGKAVFGDYDADYEPVLMPQEYCVNCF